MKSTDELDGNCVFESLEDRKLFASVGLNAGVLTITGDANAANRISVTIDSRGRMWGLANNLGASYPASQVNSIKIVGGNLADALTIAANVGKPAYIDGGGGNDTIKGSAGSDTVFGGTGNDLITASTSADEIHGGDGDDTIFGAGGNDVVFGDAGNDTITTDAGNDTIDGGAGTNTVSAGGGTNVVTNAGTANTPTDTGNTGGSGNTGDTGTGSTGNTGTTGGTTGGTTNGGGGGTTTPTDPPPQNPPPVTNPGGVDATAPVARIDAIATSILPGQSAFVNALNSTLNGGSALTTKYEWDFGDAGSRFNTLVGWNAGHSYANAGTYTVTLKVTNQAGKTSTATQTINVAADTRRTLYVDSANGSDANAGTSAAAPLRTFAKAASLLTANTKVLFARGGTYPVAATMNLQDNVTLGAYGAGNSPVLLWTGELVANANFLSSYTAKGVVVENLTFDTQGFADWAMPTVLSVGGTNVTVRGNTFLHLSTAVNANGNPAGLMVQDNVQPLADGMQGYLVWLQGSDSVIVGNTSVNSTRQHNLRASAGFTRTLISDNSFTNLDRRGVGDAGDFSKQTINLQTGSWAYVRNNTVADGSVQLGPLGGADAIAQHPDTAPLDRTSWLVFEGNTANNTRVELHHGLENASVRSNVVNFDNGISFWVEGYDTTYRRMVSNVAIVGNTAIDNGTTGNFIMVQGQSGGLVLENNLYVAPNLLIGAYDTAAVLVKYADLSGFASIKNNAWPKPPAANRNWWSDGGVNYVSATNAREGYQTEAEWEAQAVVQNDIFQAVTLQAGRYAFSSASITYGAVTSKVGL